MIKSRTRSWRSVGGVGCMKAYQRRYFCFLLLLFFRWGVVMVRQSSWVQLWIIQQGAALHSFHHQSPPLWLYRHHGEPDGKIKSTSCCRLLFIVYENKWFLSVCRNPPPHTTTVADKGQTDGNCSIRHSSRKQLQVQKRCKITNSNTSLNEVQNEESGANEKKSAVKDRHMHHHQTCCK